MDLEETLSNFREKWLQELSESSSKTAVSKNADDSCDCDPVLEVIFDGVVKTHLKLMRLLGRCKIFERCRNGKGW